MPELKNFLVVFDRAKNKQVDLIEFGSDTRAAAKKYGELEIQHFGDSNIEIVLLGADSVETLKKTHSTYFDNVTESFFQTLATL